MDGGQSGGDGRPLSSATDAPPRRFSLGGGMVGTQLEIVAHRGASALAPENTLAAFAAALDLGVGTIETDLRATRDGELVLAHDADFSRLTGRSLRVESCTLAELRAVAIGHDKRGIEQVIATPIELLRLVHGRARVLFDLKIDFAEFAGLLPLLREMEVERQVILGVRSVDALRSIKDANPHLATLAFGRTPQDVWALSKAGAEILRLWATWLDDTTLTRARQSGKPIWIMCGGPARGDVGEATLPELLDYRRRGLDAVILNDPRLAIAANASELASSAPPPDTSPR